MASNLQHEPTMEEILASIRKIISEDSNENAQPSERGDDEFDVLELRREDVLDEPARPEPLAHESAVAAAPSETLPMTTIEDSPGHDGEESIFSDSARKAMHDAFAKLDALSDEPLTPEPAPATALHSGASVQEVFEHAIRGAFGPAAGSYLRDNADEIIDRMKPIIREWMDEHFPAILEGAVRNEVERAVRASAQKPPRR
jgi:uncharacterized protein